MNLGPRETLRYFAEELVGVELNPGQTTLVELIDSRGDELREIVVRKGRRIGMTMAASLVAGWYGTVLAPRLRQHVLARENFRIALVATSRDQAALMLRFIRGFFEESPMLAEQIASETSDTLRLVSGCEIVASVCSARAHRGWPNALVIIDEAAHYIESEGNMSLSSLLEALRPSQSQFGSLALMLAISTPLDASGAFHELEQQAASGQFSDMAALHLPTIEARPDFAAEAERDRARNPRQYAREWLGEYTSEDEAFPLDVFDACVDADYRPPYEDPTRPIVLGLDGAVSRDSMGLVGVDEDWNLVYVREWKPPLGGAIDHREVLAELLDLDRRFDIRVVGYDPSQIHGLLLEGLDAGLPMTSVSQAAGLRGGTMARYASLLVESLHEKRLRLFPCAELREHVARARFTARAGADRLTKSKSSDRIDLAVALAMAVGVLTDKWRDYFLKYEEEEVVSISAAEIAQDYAQTRADFYATLAAEAAEAGDFGRARDLLNSLDEWRDPL